MEPECTNASLVPGLNYSFKRLAQVDGESLAVY